MTPILTYHSLDGSGSVVSTEPALFRRQMESLRDWGFTGVSLGQLCDAWDGAAPSPARPVAITFDDGFRNVREHAMPVLRELGFRATLFVVAGRVGATNDWEREAGQVPRLPTCTWDELVELRDAGWEIGAHGMTHAALPELTPAEAEEEILGSGRTIAERLGNEVRTFAYPYGRFLPGHRRVAAAHYRAACGVALRAAERGDDRASLPRLDMYYYRSPAAFRTFPTFVGPLYVALRALGRSVRGTGRA